MREGRSGPFPINKPLFSYEKAHGRKANSRNTYWEAIVGRRLRQGKLGVTGSVTWILTEEFQTQLLNI